VRTSGLLLLLSAVLLTGCAEYKEYRYRDFTVSQENAYTAMLTLLRGEGYQVNKVSRNVANNLPEVYIETDWNMSQTGNPYHGNDYRRRAFVKITTLYSERDPHEYQPLDEADAERMREMADADRKRAELEHTRISVAVRLERRRDVRGPMDAQWAYVGQDSYEVAALLGRYEAMFGDTRGGGGSPSARGAGLKEQELRSRQGN
jgi:hypothetical protein